jgi:hypothetical protein
MIPEILVDVLNDFQIFFSNRSQANFDGNGSGGLDQIFN